MLADALREAGVAVVEGLLSPGQVAQIDDELEPYLKRAPRGQGTFVGLRTRRTSRLVAKSRTCRRLIVNPLVLSTIEQVFHGECYDFQLHGTQASKVESGERAQSLHRDDGVFPFRHPCPPAVINAIWALDDFRADNGATRVIVGSHHWDDERRPVETQSIPVNMTQGSVLLFDSAVYHGAGANTSGHSRTGLIIGYSLGWLRQEENPILAVPPALARTLPRRLRELAGYRNHGYLGSFEGCSPERALADFVADVLPAEDLYTSELEGTTIRRR